MRATKLVDMIRGLYLDRVGIPKKHSDGNVVRDEDGNEVR